MILKPRWRKVVSDLTANKGRTLLVVTAIAVGVFAFGSVFITQEILVKNLVREYQATKSSNISLFVGQFDETLVRWVEDQEGVKAAQARVSQRVQMVLDDGTEKDLVLNSYPNYSKLTLNLLQPKTGTWPPEKGEIVLERNSLAAVDKATGEQLTIKIGQNNEKKLVFVGSVYDNSSVPYVFTQQISGFISWETLPELGYPKRYNQLDIVTSPDITTLSEAENLANDLTEKLKERNVLVNGSMVLPPNEHWAEDNSKAFTAILSVIGVFSLILSGFLVVNTVSAILAQQKKQIGIMKAIGGTRRQVTSIYLITVVVYGLLALVVALPVGMGLSYVFLKMISDFLNLDIEVFYLPWSVFLMQLASALAVPVIAALIPIIQSSKSAIRVSLSDYQPNRQTGQLEHLLTKIKGLPRPYLISIRNVFRKKGRLFLTLGTLVIAGAVFISVINVRSGMYQELTRILQMFEFEVSLGLSESQPVEPIISRIRTVEGVTAVEARNGMSVRRVKEDGSKGGYFGISGLPPDTVFSKPVILSGRWLTNADRDQVVLSSAYIRDNTDLTVGDQMRISYGDNKEGNIEIAGIIAMAGDQKLGFMNFTQVALMKDEPRRASSYLIKTEPNDPATQEKVLTAVVDKLEGSNIVVSSKETRGQIFSSAENQFNFLIFFLLAMAVMIAIVGGLGLAGTMSLNVLERTREIGIMRSIGAGDSMIRKVVLIEGLVVGFISWLIAIPFSFPITYGFGYAIGNAFFGRTLVFTVVPQGMLIWLAIVMVIAVIASLLPAQRASKTSINETLAYE